MAIIEFLDKLPLLPDYVRQSYPKIGYAIYTLEAIVALLIATYLYLYSYKEFISPLKNLRGPKSDNFLFGKVPTFISEEPQRSHKKWILKYGLTFKYKMLFNFEELFLADPIGLQYILSNSYKFPKPEQTSNALLEMTGNGVLVAEGDIHKKQRKLLNPSFTPLNIKGMFDIFYDKSEQLKEKWSSLIENQDNDNNNKEDSTSLSSYGAASPTPPKPEDKIKGTKKIDIMSWLGKATLDIIGLAGFNYDFNALEDPNNELALAFNKMFSEGMKITIPVVLQAIFPIFRIIPTERSRVIQASSDKTKEIGRKLIEDKKKVILAAHTDGHLEKKEDIGNDLLSHLIKANMASDLRPDQRLTDDEVLAQITTFMLAGNETSSTALTWILYTLAQHPDSQKQLREELMTISEERPSLDTLNSLPYLDAVIREVLRLEAPAPHTMRMALEDSIIPLGKPVKGKNGKMIDSLKIKKGTEIMIPILSVNTSTEIWGSDADQYNPNRFLGSNNKSEKDGGKIPNIPGVWGNLLTFLGGTRNCIGFKFALAEIKVMLFVLLKSFEFLELPSNPKIERKSSVVMRPRVIGEEDAGLQLPLLVKPVST
ncbi:uncharacterized protein L201_005945 [Kwoniella dendrophila CBS 6074]|uniref:Cytochrome P450 n=1 Tax=Kwoniella dendrophila CBS 6074 TaxID=1295534 RepID=A0AAX4JZW3_9TREE